MGERGGGGRGGTQHLAYSPVPDQDQSEEGGRERKREEKGIPETKNPRQEQALVIVGLNFSRDWKRGHVPEMVPNMKSVHVVLLI